MQIAGTAKAMASTFKTYTTASYNNKTLCRQSQLRRHLLRGLNKGVKIKFIQFFHENRAVKNEPTKLYVLRAENSGAVEKAD